MCLFKGTIEFYSKKNINCTANNKVVSYLNKIINVVSLKTKTNNNNQNKQQIKHPYKAQPACHPACKSDQPRLHVT